jgi:hypothetical protein
MRTITASAAVGGCAAGLVALAVTAVPGGRWR